MTQEDKAIEIPFGAKDSELLEWVYFIPEGMEAEIKDRKVIIKKAESEDERIRKHIIEILNSLPGCYWHGEKDKSDCVTYLEKQKDIEDRWIEDREQCFWNGVEEGKMLAEKQKEQKPADLSEMMVHKEPYIAPVPTPMVADEQKPERSEEDERIRKAILGFLNPDKGGTKYSSNAELVEWSDWLKSLRPSWKPSKEQMRELKTSYSYWQGITAEIPNTKLLESLYNDLKKLM